MFINHFIIAIVFRLINFGIILFIGAYLFKKYALPVIYELMAQKESEKELLLSQQLFFENKHRDLDLIIQRDALRCENLKIKINEWKKASEQERCAQEKTQLEAIEAIEKKYIKKREMQKEALIQSAVASAVVSDLRASLEKHFEQNDSGEEYLNEIIHVISERAL